MSTVNLKMLKHAVMDLPESERAKLACDLLASLDGSSDKEFAAAWDIEVCKRINEIEAGTAELLDVDDVLTKARERLGS